MQPGNAGKSFLVPAAIVMARFAITAYLLVRARKASLNGSAPLSASRITFREEREAPPGPKSLSIAC